MVRRLVSLPVLLDDGGEAPAHLASFDHLSDSREHVALVFGDATAGCLVRVHSECLTGDVLGSARCDCGPQLRESIAVLAKNGGVLLYLRQEGRGIGLYNKVDSYALQEGGLDTFAANRQLDFADDERDYSVASEM
ncbi:MAG: GTP cyclohydrolase II RibA, partial [Chloroflexota bacterium]|nr:GTP cyclohydrolase II RibA [Chloroflexota bacterium]